MMNSNPFTIIRVTLKDRAIRSILPLFLCLFIPSIVFHVAKGETPYDAELVFVEQSNNSKYVGSVVPASCDSTPPTNAHGNCPPAVAVNLSTGGNNITFEFNVTNNEGFSVTRHGSSDYWTIGNSSQPSSNETINARIGLTAHGATGCSSSLDGFSVMSPAASLFYFPVPETGYTGVPVSYTIACTNGTHWVSRTFNFYGDFYYYYDDPEDYYSD